MIDTSKSQRSLVFGPKQHWLAVRDRPTSSVAHALGLSQIRQVSLAEGLDLIENHTGANVGRILFITPPIGQWTLVIGGSDVIPQAGSPLWVSFLEKTSAKLGHVQYFGSHRVVGYVAWAQSENGQVNRAYAYSEEMAKTISNIGSPTEGERELGIDFIDERFASSSEIDAHETRLDDIANEIHKYTLKNTKEALSIEEQRRLKELIIKYDMMTPNESSVFLVAGRWSIDPTQPGSLTGAAQDGLIGVL